MPVDATGLPQRRQAVSGRFVRGGVGTAPTPWPARGPVRGRSSLPPHPTSWSAQRVRVGDRQAAGEVAADVGGRPAVELGPARRAAGPRRRAGSAATATTRFGPVARPSRGQQRRVAGSVGLADDRQLDDSARARGRAADEPLREPGRVAAEERRRPSQRALGGVAVAPLAGQRGEPQQDGRRHRAAGRRRVVLDVLRPGDERLVVVGRVEEAAGRVGEVLEDRVGERRGRRRTSARRTSPRTARAGRRRGCA